MQGAFAEHVRALRRMSVHAIEVRTKAELDSCDGIVIPGGESTAIRKALDRCELLAPLRERIASGMPAFGTCAGMIVLADAEPDGAPPCLGLLDVDVQRNGWGRQLHSAELPIEYGDGSTSTGVFIRAPRITRVGERVQVIARLANGDLEPIAVRQGSIMASSFHPELTDDDALHRSFVDLARSRTASGVSSRADMHRD